MAAPDTLAIDPAMPCALAAPWPGAWATVGFVYDLYRCMSFVDDQGTYMADSRRALRALEDQLAHIEATPATPAKGQALYEWQLAYSAWQRADAIHQLQYFLVRVEYPNGTDAPGRDPATWARYATDQLLWLANAGYAAAKAELTGEKKVMPSLRPTPSASAVPPPVPISASTAT